MAKALVVLSGGQDSVTCLGVALRNHIEVEAISFRYGQRHEVELAAAEALCEELKIPWRDVALDFFPDLVTSALLEKDTSVNEEHKYKKGLPASFVPNRNALFLTLAHAYAQEIGADTIYTGVCQTDYSGYPDCRLHFIESLSYALNKGYETNIVIKTPLMYLNKAQTFKLADDVDFLGHVINSSVTCYNGNIRTVNTWGLGCGECPACILRAKGYAEFVKMEESS